MHTHTCAHGNMSTKQRQLKIVMLLGMVGVQAAKQVGRLITIQVELHRLVGIVTSSTNRHEFY